MKTRIDETNKMRKLMGLPLIKEQIEPYHDNLEQLNPNPGGVYNKPIKDPQTSDPTTPNMAYGWIIMRMRMGYNYPEN